MGLDLTEWRTKRRREMYSAHIHDEIVIGDPMEMWKGQVYLHLKSKTPVRVIGSRIQCWNGSGYVWLYPVESLVGEDVSRAARADLSREPLNEMEVLAWAAM